MKEVKCADCAYVYDISHPITNWDGHRSSGCLSNSDYKIYDGCADCLRQCPVFRGRDNNELKEEVEIS